MVCWVEDCLREARWISVGEREELLCTTHAGKAVYEANASDKPTAVCLLRIDCEGPYVKTLLARLTGDKEEEGYPELVRKG